MAKAPGYTFTTVDRSIDPVLCKRGKGGPTILNRGGGWEVVARARRKGITQWVGAEPARMAVPVLFDGFRDRQGQELAIGRLSRMALPPEPTKPPPLIRVTPGLPIGGIKWVIQQIEWGDDQIWERDSGGSIVRMRQDGTVTLLEYVPPELLGVGAPGPGTSDNARIDRRLYTVGDGDNLVSIAVNELGDRNMWTTIADYNDIRDPNTLDVGQLLRLPG